MRQDVELAIARKLEELRVEVEKQLESQHAESLAERKEGFERVTYFLRLLTKFQEPLSLI